MKSIACSAGSRAIDDIFSRFEKLDVMFTASINFAPIADGLRLC